MNVVLLLQAGDTGPIFVSTTTKAALNRRIVAVQQHNAALIRVAEILDGDERLERELHVAFTAGGMHVRGDWYDADALKLVADDTPRVARDYMGEERRIAAQRVADRARVR